MHVRLRFGWLIAGLAVLLGGSREAAADLILSFDQSSYTIDGIGNTTAVQVFLSQTPGDPQVGVGNELLTAAVEVTFSTTGSAIVASDSDVTPGPSWDASSVIISPSGSDTVVDLGLTSLAGISDLSTPLLLGTFVFTGQSLGITNITLATLGPGPSFITAQGNILDPTNTPGAQIEVKSSSGSVPEPSAIVLTSIGGVLFGTGWLRRRKRVGSLVQ